MTKIAVFGAGSWGTALASHLRLAGNQVSLWGRNSKVLSDIDNLSENSRYLPGIRLNSGIKTSTDISSVSKDAEIGVIAVPSSALSSVLGNQEVKNIPSLISVAKGLEDSSYRRMTEVIADAVSTHNSIASTIGVLSGPSFAKEVAEGKPTAVTIASLSSEDARRLASVFHFGNFRVYTSTDVKGVEFAAAFKNVIALASGIVDGHGLGFNARAALITRGLAEVTRLSVSLGGKAETLYGLSGLGDLLLTCTGDLSRNRRVGLALGKGKQLKDCLSEVKQVVEGVSTAPKMLALAKKNGIEVPVAEQVVRILNGQCSIEESIQILFSRNPTSES